MTPAEPEASVRKLPATDAFAVMPNFLSPFSLKCMLLIAADHVVRRTTRYDRVHAASEREGVGADNLLD